MSSSNCCFLTCFLQISQEAGHVVWYSCLFQNFPQFVVIHTVKGFVIVNKAEIDIFLELSCFFDDPPDVSNLISGSSAYSKTSLNIWKFMVHILLKAGLSLLGLLKTSSKYGSQILPSMQNLSTKPLEETQMNPYWPPPLSTPQYKLLSNVYYRPLLFTYLITPSLFSFLYILDKDM